MYHHLFEHIITFFGVNELYHFNFIELMQAVKSPYILTITSCFSSETWCVCSHFYGQVSFFDDLIPVNVCYGHFCCWYKVKIISCNMIHLAFLIGELPGSICRILVHNKRWNIFRVTCSSEKKKKILDQGALKFCTIASIK